MDVKELLDDDAFDQKKLFDENQYGTLIVNREGFTAKQNEAADLLAAIVERETTRAEKDEIFKNLKELNAGAILIDAVKNSERDEDTIKLLSACWETGIDFSAHLLFFVEFVLQDNFLIAVEALTVIENTESIDAASAEKALALIAASKKGNADFKSAVNTYLRNFIS